MADEGNEPVREADVVVVGGGPVGENLAQYALEAGCSVVLVEAALLGGECSYYACMPSKALLRPLEVLAAAQHLGGVTGAGLDRESLLARRDEWVSHYQDSGQVRWAQGLGIDVVRGHARLVGERLVEVEGTQGRTRWEARVAVVLATGSAPVVPEQLASLVPWGSRDATAVREVPERLVVVGGGVVAVEAATWMAALGAQVTVVARGELLAGAEPFAGPLVARGLRERGVDVRTRTTVLRADRPRTGEPVLGRVHGGPVTIEVGGATPGRLTADEILVATGRRPALDDVGLEDVGLTREDVGAGRLPGWLHVIGDAGQGAPLTHMGKYEARVLGARLGARLSGHPSGHDSFVPPVVPVPQVVFTDPQVAWVGLTREVAGQEGRDVVVAEVLFASAAGASLLRDDSDGRASLVVERGTGRVLGATFVGPSAGELLHAATVAIVSQAPVRVLRHAVPAYPTASELWLRLLEELPVELR